MANLGTLLVKKWKRGESLGKLSKSVAQTGNDAISRVLQHRLLTPVSFRASFDERSSSARKEIL
jgi:hypothetical protein